jgi:mevalonate kinase
MIKLFNDYQSALVKLKVSTKLINLITSKLSMICGIKITGGGGGGCLLIVHDEKVSESLFLEILGDIGISENINITNNRKHGPDLGRNE